MKVKNNIPPKLFAGDQPILYWQVRITTRNGQWADLRFSEKSSAQSEFNRIRTSCIFAEQWINDIQLNEVK